MRLLHTFIFERYAHPFRLLPLLEALDRQTDRQTDRRTDGRIAALLNAPSYEREQYEMRTTDNVRGKHTACPKYQNNGVNATDEGDPHVVAVPSISVRVAWPADGARVHGTRRNGAT